MSIISLIGEAEACRGDLIEISRELLDISSRLRSLATGRELPDEEAVEDLMIKATLVKMADGLATMRRLRLATRLNRNAGLKARVEMEEARS